MPGDHVTARRCGPAARGSRSRDTALLLLLEDSVAAATAARGGPLLSRLDKAALLLVLEVHTAAAATADAGGNPLHLAASGGAGKEALSLLPEAHTAAAATADADAACVRRLGRRQSPSSGVSPTRATLLDFDAGWQEAGRGARPSRDRGGGGGADRRRQPAAAGGGCGPGWASKRIDPASRRWRAV